VVVASNHFHLLLSPDDSKQLADFMCHLNGNLSKKIGRLHDWSGSMFERRYQCIPVSDEPKAQQARLRYHLQHGCKENLVLSPLDWPGLHSAGPLCTGKPIEGTWISGTKFRAARNRGEDVTPSQFGTEYQIHLEPLPCWEHLEESVWRGYVREMVKNIEEETIADHRRNQTVPCGATAVLQKSPHYVPARQSKSPAPWFHAATERAWQAMFVGLQEFVVAYREAAERVKLGLALVQFPGDCFPSRLPFVPPD
jgi:hypothetical protein